MSTILLSTIEYYTCVSVLDLREEEPDHEREEGEDESDGVGIGELRRGQQTLHILTPLSNSLSYHDCEGCCVNSEHSSAHTKLTTAAPTASISCYTASPPSQSAA